MRIRVLEEIKSVKWNRGPNPIPLPQTEEETKFNQGVREGKGVNRE